jgi:hypothetical protein
MMPVRAITTFLPTDESRNPGPAAALRARLESEAGIGTPFVCQGKTRKSRHFQGHFLVTAGMVLRWHPSDHHCREL